MKMGSMMNCRIRASTMPTLLFRRTVAPIVRWALVLLCVPWAMSHSSDSASGESVVVVTELGSVAGKAETNHETFLNIPFAKPPVGPLRFQPPAPPTPWKGLRDATRPPPQCMQPRRNNQWEMSEDCLYLNIYRPRKRARPLAVMVELYGGGFVIGAANDYDGGIIAEKGGVVVVAINYRLGPFGFLTLPELIAEDASGLSVNYGFQDQQAGLGWVRRNIAAFGGDPNNVTIFGESAGGYSVCMHLVAPASRGLFHHAISQSGFCAWDLMTETDAATTGAVYAAKVGCGKDSSNVGECLRSRTTEELLGSNGFDIQSLGKFRPVADGKVLPLNMLKAFSSGDFAHVPLIMGNTRDEGSMFVVLKDGIKGPITADDYAAIVKKAYGGAAERVLAEYPAKQYSTAAQARAAQMTDGVFVCPVHLTISALAPQIPVFAYEFAYHGAASRAPLPPIPGLDYGATHSTEVGYVYGHGALGDLPGPPLTPEETQVSDELIGYWTRFASTGNPNRPLADKAANWPAYIPAKDDVLVFDDKAHMEQTSKTHKCAFWDSSGLVQTQYPN